MKKQLVIVESPAKAKTIERFLGNDYNVLSSFGHIRDLPKKGLSVDIEHDFKPTYEIDVYKRQLQTQTHSITNQGIVFHQPRHPMFKYQHRTPHLRQAQLHLTQWA